ncbi:MAG: GNAT family N-acetyltransferase [Chloroflexi bacterium]|nr:GNAT family N-acetyltransferase [Chloroflexota bacterium]MBU1751593.1 GNAT family N-acetyltransferase [Chloroflexota bacterium]MBU1877311.1 GNAT family N-acetyltransferase [Chloroflexota bacterium]
MHDAVELARLRWDFDREYALTSHQSLDDFAPGFAAFLKRALGSGQWVIWVAEREGRLIGHIYVQAILKVPRPGLLNRWYGYVTNVYVEPDARSAGIGSAILSRVIAWAREARLEFLIVWPAEPSVEFYARQGFAPSPDALELHFADTGNNPEESR